MRVSVRSCRTGIVSRFRVVGVVSPCVFLWSFGFVLGVFWWFVGVFWFVWVLVWY